MISIGLSGWGDHDSLYGKGVSPGNKLRSYSNYFPIVEVDSSFYALQPAKNYAKWSSDTPAGFSFIVKAYQGMTGHLRDESPFSTKESMFQAFLESIIPLQETGKLKMVLFQYPPWFACERENVQLLRYTKEQMKDLPVAIEFRNQSWFSDEMNEKTLQFLQQEGWIHSICDEPQAGVGSVPTVLCPTSSDATLVRFHGRNAAGWNNSGSKDWRAVRYLYHYSRDELEEWKEKLESLTQSTREICVIFNNNSGGDAAVNALELMELLGMLGKGLTFPAYQLDLFEFD
ncbi:MAG: hypothetical protein JWN30_996 [Bacilli bacterium]|nr:hypothetical protein [Bacilli bacterium]